MQFSNELLKNFKDERINIFIYGNKKLVMKKILLSFVIIVSVIATIAFASNASALTQADTDYLRIHVRANSNEQIDQSIKYIVKDKVVEFITPYAAQCTDKQTAITVIGGILDEIEDVCDRVLEENGFNYVSKASVRAEEFPTRVYGDLTLESGIYDALIIELGTGEGENWWCVIYPPLCFTSGTADVQYRSAIYEIIQRFKRNA